MRRGLAREHCSWIGMAETAQRAHERARRPWAYPQVKLGILADSTWLTELYRRGLVARTREDIPSGFQYLYRRADSAGIRPGISLGIQGGDRAEDLPAAGKNL